MVNKIKKFYSTKRLQKIIVSILAVILVIGGIAFATLYTPASTSKVNVSITLTSKDIEKKVIVNAYVEIVKDKTVTEKVSMPLNKATTLNTQLEAGNYVIHMTSAPIESDGSTYKIPTKIDNIVISNKDVKSGKTIKVEVSLERIAIADMTKEQLVDVIARISKEAPDKNKELIKSLKKRQATAISTNENKKDDTDKESKAEDTPKEEIKSSTSNGGSTGGSTSTSSNSSGSGSGSSGSSTSGGNTSSAHVHQWTSSSHVYHMDKDAEGYLETVSPAVTKDVVNIVFTDGCSYTEDANTIQAHDDSHGVMNYTWEPIVVVITPEVTRWVETSPAISGYLEIIEKCACGATNSHKEECAFCH